MNHEAIRTAIKNAKLGFRPARVFVVYQEWKLASQDQVVWTEEHEALVSDGYGRRYFPADWRWRLLSPSQRSDKWIVGGSMEDFDSKSNAIRSAKKECSYYAANRAAVVVLDL